MLNDTAVVVIDMQPMMRALGPTTDKRDGSLSCTGRDCRKQHLMLDQASQPGAQLIYAIGENGIGPRQD